MSTTQAPRIVIVEQWENTPGTRDGAMINRGQAVFHGFSIDHEEYETGPGLFPVAIVEFPDGHVETVRAERIRFLKPMITKATP